MPRSAYTTVVELAGEQQGYVTQEDARRAGIAPTTLARMAERGTLVRTSHGVYRVPLIPAGPLDQYREATLWPRGVRGVLSNETALGLGQYARHLREKHLHEVVTDWRQRFDEYEASRLLYGKA